MTTAIIQRRAIVETPFMQFRRHVRNIDRAVSTLATIETATPTDLTMAEKALFDAEQAVKKAKRALLTARITTDMTRMVNGPRT